MKASEVYEKYGLSPEMDKDIDPDNLDVEWFDHVNVFMQYTDAHGQAMFLRDQAKLEMDKKKELIEKVKSEVSLKARKQPELFGIEKVTDPTIDSAVKTSNRYIEACEEYFNAAAELNQRKAEAQILHDAIKGMEQRKASLENAVRMTSMGYFAQPTEPRENLKSKLSAKREERTKINQTISDALDEAEDEDLEKDKKEGGNNNNNKTKTRKKRGKK